MSIPKKMMIDCPQCRTTFSQIVWESANTDLSPELPLKIISGDFFAFTCPTCGFHGHLIYRMLYHDLKHCTMIWLVPRSNGQNDTIKEIRKTPEFPGYITRIVGDIGELGEKVSALEAGRDDRVIETYKLLITSQIMQTITNPGKIRIFYTYDGKQEYFKVVNGADAPRVCLFESEVYDKQAYMLKSLLSGSQEKYSIVDQTWAITALDQLEQKAVNCGLTLAQKPQTILSKVSRLFKRN